MTRQQTHVLYRIRNGVGDLLYIGITNNPSSRFSDHRGKKWWQRVADIAIEHHGSREELRAAETAAIRDEAPWFNGLSAQEIDDIVDFDDIEELEDHAIGDALAHIAIDADAGAEPNEFAALYAEYAQRDVDRRLMSA